MSSGNFIERHYSRHASHFENDLVESERVRISTSWFDESTADFWRHARAYECAGLLSHRSHASWLTVGDGRWGLDSIRIRSKGFSTVTASDISEALLRAAKERGLIAAYAVENAEHLSFADDSYDFVFCKESLHHFPRPFAALYEMLRVAREAVFIIEPNDTVEIVAPAPVSPPPARPGRIRRALGALLGREYPAGAATGVRPALRFNKPDWESSGNFAYSVSRRELEKVALGLNLPQLVVKGLNDHYIKGCEFEPADESKSAIFRELRRVIGDKDRHCAQGFSEFNLIMAGFFRKPIDDEARANFLAAGWEVMDLPANPYVPRDGA